MGERPAGTLSRPRATSAKLLVVAGLAFGAGILVGRQLHPSVPQLTARADTLDVAAASLDSAIAARREADNVRIWAAARRTALARAHAAAIADTATRLATLPLPPAPENCTVQLEALRGLVLRLVPSTDSALTAAAAELTLWQAMVAARDSSITELQAQRDTARVLLRQALASARPWPTWRALLVGATCAGAGWLLANDDRITAAASGVACALSLGRFLGRAQPRRLPALLLGSPRHEVVN